MQVDLYTIGQVGLNLDLQGHELPPEALTLVKNARFRRGMGERVGGQESVYPGLQRAPYFLLPLAVPSLQKIYWMYFGLTGASIYVDGTHTDISRVAPYTGTVASLWSGAVLQGIPVVTNGADAPQMWKPVSLAQKLLDLSNWPASTTCKLIKSFKSYLLAFDITESGTRYPHMVRWSTATDPGAVPTSWDYTLTTNDAGRTVIAEEGGAIIEAAAMRDVLMVYRETAITAIEFIGGVNIFKFRTVVTDVPILGPRCATTISDGVMQFVALKDDFIVCDGQQIRSVAEKRVRKVFETIDPTNYRTSFVVSYPAKKEVWFCYPEVGYYMPNKAITWNWRDDTWGMRDLNATIHAASGLAIPFNATDTWDGDTATWDSDLSAWDSSSQSATVADLLLARVNNNGTFGVDITNGDFSGGATSWTAGAGWVIGGSVATATVANGALVNTSLTPTVGKSYEITYTLSGVSVGSVQLNLGGINGTARNANGVYTDTVLATTNGQLTFTGTGFTGILDSITVRRLDLYKADSTALNDGMVYTTILERTELAVTGRDRMGEWKTDFTVRKGTTEQWLHITGDVVSFQMGAKDRQGLGYNWTDPQTYTPATDRKTDLIIAGSMLAHRVTAMAGVFFMQGLSFDVNPMGRY